MSTISVQLNAAQHENNRSSFDAFGGSTWAGFNVKADEPLHAGSMDLVGRTLSTSAVVLDHLDVPTSRENTAGLQTIS